MELDNQKIQSKSNYNATLNYIGSKKSLLDFLDLIISKLIKNDSKTCIKFADLFAGTGIVGKYFNRKYNYITTSNDLEYYSYIINWANLKVQFSLKLANLICELNKLIEPNLNDSVNLIQKNYSPLGKDKRLFWTESNAKKADAIINNINKLSSSGDINFDEKIFLIASLITSLDKSANTTSVYGAFLKEFKKTAQGLFELKPIHTDMLIPNLKSNLIFNTDINSNILDNEWDIVYLDPPYNSRQYASNYAPLNYIAKYDSKIEVYGKTGLIKNYNKSKFCSELTAKNEFIQLINKIKAKFIVVSYNNEGLVNKNDFIKILQIKGNVKLYKKLYKKYKSSEKQINENVFEYLYVCSINDSTKKTFEEIIIDMENPPNEIIV